MEEHSWVDEEGNFHLKSIEDDLCHIILSANLLHFRVQYRHLLPGKKQDWVGVEQKSAILPHNNLSTIQAERPYGEFDDNMSLNASAMRSQRSMQGRYSASHMLPKATGLGHQRQMRMMHQYVQVE